MSDVRERLGLLRRGGAPPLLLSSSHPTTFCPGWDITQLENADRRQLEETLTAFNLLILDLFSYPGPTAAAIAGHAVAAGCQLALACDLRIMARGRPRIGFAELNLGVPVPAGSLIMLKARLSPAVVEELVLCGEGCDADRALEYGVVQRVVRPLDVESTTDRELRKLGSRAAGAFATTKSYLFGDRWQQMRQAAIDDQESFLECWFEEATRQRIANVVRTLGSDD
jgi:enoyl-CoA hydratase